MKAAINRTTHGTLQFNSVPTTAGFHFRIYSMHNEWIHFRTDPNGRKSLSFLTYSESTTCFSYIQVKIYLGCGWAEEELSLVCVAKRLCEGGTFHEIKQYIYIS